MKYFVLLRVHTTSGDYPAWDVEGSFIVDPPETATTIDPGA